MLGEFTLENVKKADEKAMQHPQICISVTTTLINAVRRSLRLQKKHNRKHVLT